MKIHTHKHRRGFTLIELMAVITIIVILAGLVVGGMGFVSERQAKEKCRVQIALLSKGLEAYKLDIGMYPLSSNVATVSTPNGSNNSASLLYTPLFYEGYDYVKSNSPTTWTKKVGTVDVSKATTIYIADLDPTTSKQGWVDPVTGSTVPASVAVKDPWGNQFCYRTATPPPTSATTAPSPNANTQNPDFDLWSMGKDGRSDASNPSTTTANSPNKDDIRNF